MLQHFTHLRTKLLVSMIAVVFFLTAAVLAMVQARTRRQIRADLGSTLRTQSRVYAEMEGLRREQAGLSASFIANQPSIKALMSTNDGPTVQDGSQWILPASHADLLLLENTSGRLLGLHARSDEVTGSTVIPLLQSTAGGQDWWLINGHLYDVNLVPIFAGAGLEQRALGRMALGREMRRETILSSGDFGKSAFTFERQGHVLLSSLPQDVWQEFELALPHDTPPSNTDRVFHIRGERWLASFVELGGDHPVRLYCLQSFDQATSFLRALNRRLALLGAVAVLAGAFIAFLLSRQITRPIEQLVAGAKRLQKGDFDFQISVRGHDEVTVLSRAFNEMRVSLKESRETMLRAARLEAVGRLAGGVAHDFNNLVMIIKGYSDMLIDAVPAQSRPQLEEIKKAGDRASALTRQLLAFSRKQVLEPQILDPNQIVRNMVKMLRVLIGADIEFKTNLSDQVGSIHADSGQIEQVVMNLVVNARDAMPRGGKLIVETRSAQLHEADVASKPGVRVGNYVLIAVTDNGVGMDKATLAHVFEPFFTTKEQGKGTGLGLATVYGIVEQSKGHIVVDSELGAGTTFKVYLPALSIAAPVPQVPSSALALKGTGIVLLVEDEPALRLLTAASLRGFGYTVMEAENGADALLVADAHSGKIDIVVADIVMPQMGGPELVSNLRAKRGGFATIFISGYSQAEAFDRTQSGSDAVLLHKPFTAETLAAKIQERLAAKSDSATAGTY